MWTEEDLKGPCDEIGPEESKPPCGPFVGLLAGDQYPHGSYMGGVAGQRKKGDARTKRQRNIRKNQPEVFHALRILQLRKIGNMLEQFRNLA